MKLLTNPAEAGDADIETNRLWDWPEDHGSFWPLLGEWLGITALACGIVVAGAAVGLYRAQPDLDRESGAFADQSMRAVAAGWGPSALLSRAVPELAAHPGPYIATLDRLRRERAVQAGDCLGRSSSNILTTGDLITAQYYCQLRVGRRPALASLSLQDDRDQWRVTGFYVDGPK